MLWVIDGGNSRLSMAIFEKKRCLFHWNLATNLQQSAEEYLSEIKGTFLAYKIPKEAIQGCIISSVTPTLSPVLSTVVEEFIGLFPIQFNLNLQLGLQLDVLEPLQVGHDRIINGIAALASWEPPLIVVDFGTATTIDVFNAPNQFIGGAICPGLSIMQQGLVERTEQLFEVPIEAPERVIGKNTKQALQSGIVLGYAGMIESLLQKVRNELDVQQIKVIATGGYSSLLSPHIPSITAVQSDLTLNGLRIIYEMNQ